MFNKIKQIPKKIRSSLYIIKAALGIKNRGDGTESYRALFYAAWIYLIGIPFGTLLINTFNPGIWLIVVLSILIASNFDTAIQAYSVLQKSGCKSIIVIEEL